ncbi:MAG TPA: hypothetical protein DIW17_14550 [Clostridiales bacterium]|nr:hypothetical protein [Clostridiales bacterium]HCS75080.1 hypothetical protein [Clostridiales bacterium]
MKAIRMIHVNKEIKRRPILNDINLSLDSSRIYGFLGRNGSGKTMLFRAICGLIKPTSGEIYVFDKKLGSDISFPESLGVIIENVGSISGAMHLFCRLYYCSNHIEPGSQPIYS